MRVGICRSDSSTGKMKEYHFGPIIPVVVISVGLRTGGSCVLIEAIGSEMCSLEFACLAMLRLERYAADLSNLEATSASPICYTDS